MLVKTDKSHPHVCGLIIILPGGMLVGSIATRKAYWELGPGPPPPEQSKGAAVKHIGTLLKL